MAAQCEMRFTPFSTFEPVRRLTRSMAASAAQDRAGDWHLISAEIGRTSNRAFHLRRCHCCLGASTLDRSVHGSLGLSHPPCSSGHTLGPFIAWSMVPFHHQATERPLDPIPLSLHQGLLGCGGDDRKFYQTVLTIFVVPAGVRHQGSELVPREPKPASRPFLAPSASLHGEELGFQSPHDAQGTPDTTRKSPGHWLKPIAWSNNSSYKLDMDGTVFHRREGRRDWPSQ